jgi:hypothetical protein
MATARDLFKVGALAAADYSAKQYYAMKLTAEGPPPTATLCSTAGEQAHGILQDDPGAANRGCTVQLLGTSKAVAGAAISFLAPLTVDSSGRVVTMTANNEGKIGHALRAATAAGDVIEILLTGFVEVPVVENDGFISLPLAQARELSSNNTQNLAAHGGILASDSTPTLDVINAGTDQQMEVTWAASNNDKIAWHVALPPDLDDASVMTFHAMALSGGSTDTPVLTIEAFFGVGDTDAGGNTGALAATEAEVTRTITAANVVAAPNFLTITLVPGAHTTDTVILRGAWLEYTRA